MLCIISETFDGISFSIQNLTTTPISILDGQLNLGIDAVNQSVSDHLALGVPRVDYLGADLCQLVQKDYIMGYSHTHHMPLWSAARISKNVRIQY